MRNEPRWVENVSRLSGLLGAPVAAVIMVSIGAGNLLWFDAASFALSALLIGLLVPKAASSEKKGSSGVSNTCQICMKA
ncbi:hypothetical protein [Ktedonobacter racemifer]|uniref:hypothetical protein n=1 Tax=Ktedonobacter racemifer TaxID=363277 RepID=UPI000590E89F|nr:hypothetical protein [Ktedonobacter racemifer]